MKKLAGLVLLVALLIAASAPVAQARPCGWRGGWYGGWYGGWGWRGPGFIGGPWWWGAPYAYYPYAFYPAYPSVVVNEEPQVYIEQSQGQPAGYWYYCPSAKGYYPTVPECSEDWIKVPPATQ